MPRINPIYPGPPPITAENYRHDEPMRDLLQSWGYVLEAPKPKIEIYTDGSCWPNPGTGGWGFVIYAADVIQEFHGSVEPTTNQRMELTAVIEVLKFLPENSSATLYTDSMYVVRGMTCGFKVCKKNVDLWEIALKLKNNHKIDYKWIKGHSGIPGNDRADYLASTYSRPVISGA